ncbi:hypothetical protein PLAN_70482 [Planktothrix rubescens CCAP 1459/22]|uniref:Uncharacterized protein n=1 Tax=Planktothrix rubescens CCAP 1459/22 TaxID=329571 RepID=A0A6J7ZSV3_PLARU|nr:hypothetical protein PLAN_70482 [Planktothrix rubescens NIVA-CYA 18]CAD0219043.1 hypothetical protein PL10110_140018 [Planktothrix agardhii]
MVEDGEAGLIAEVAAPGEMGVVGAMGITGAMVGVMGVALLIPVSSI